MDSEYKGHNNIYPIDLEDMQQHVGTPQRLVKILNVFMWIPESL